MFYLKNVDFYNEKLRQFMFLIFFFFLPLKLLVEYHESAGSISSIDKSSKILTVPISTTL